MHWEADKVKAALDALNEGINISPFPFISAPDSDSQSYALWTGANVKDQHFLAKLLLEDTGMKVCKVLNLPEQRKPFEQYIDSGNTCSHAQLLRGIKLMFDEPQHSNYYINAGGDVFNKASPLPDDVTAELSQLYTNEYGHPAPSKQLAPMIAILERRQQDPEYVPDRDQLKNAVEQAHAVIFAKFKYSRERYAEDSGMPNQAVFEKAIKEYGKADGPLKDHYQRLGAEGLGEADVMHHNISLLEYQRKEYIYGKLLQHLADIGSAIGVKLYRPSLSHPEVTS